MSTGGGESRAHLGQHFEVVFAGDTDGSEPARRFLDSAFVGRHNKSCKKILTTIHLFADTPRGGFRDPSRFKAVRGEIFEFRHDQIRLLCAFDGKGRLLLLHGVVKKKDDLRSQDIERAESILVAHRRRRG